MLTGYKIHRILMDLACVIHFLWTVWRNSFLIKYFVLKNMYIYVLGINCTVPDIEVFPYN